MEFHQTFTLIQIDHFIKWKIWFKQVGATAKLEYASKEKFWLQMCGMDMFLALKIVKIVLFVFFLWFYFKIWSG